MEKGRVLLCRGVSNWTKKKPGRNFGRVQNQGALNDAPLRLD
jgi:hypothetical protein